MTNLSVRNNMTNLSVRNISQAYICILLVLASQSFLSGQVKPVTDSEQVKPLKEEDVLELSPFFVSDSRGKGYRSPSATSGLKSRALIIDIPQSIMVVPRDIIDDLGQLSTVADTIKYVSAGTFSYSRVGDFQMQRGFRTGYALLDGQVDLAQYSDNVSIDSFEVIKGPTAVLYGARTSLAGAILKHSKQPLSYAQNLVRLTVGGGGLFRGEFDSSRPAATIGNTKTYYRVYGAAQKFDGFFLPDFDNRLIIGGGLRFDFSSNTSLLLQGDYFSNSALPQQNYFPDEANTDVYTGPGYEKGYDAEWSHSDIDRMWGRATLTHRLGTNWDLVASFTYNGLGRNDEGISNTALPNYVTKTIPQNFIRWWFYQYAANLQADVSGDYTLFGMKHRSTFGFASEKSMTDQKSWGYPGVVTSITNPNIYAVPRFDFDAVKANAGRTLGNRTEIFGYYMHTLQVIPEVLSLVAGTQGTVLETRSLNRDTATTTVVNTSGHPYRLGAVFKPQAVKDLSFYVNSSTMFSGGGAKGEFGPLPPVIGDVKEIGVKTAFYEGRITSTITYFDLTVSNVPIPVLNSNGVLFSVAAGKQNNKGYEVDIAFRATKNWTIMGGVYSGNIIGTNGLRQKNTLNSSWNLLTRYDFTGDTLKGFFVGASAFGHGDRVGAPWLPMKVYNAMFGYSRGKMTVMVNIENLADSLYSEGGWGNTTMEVSRPRNAKLALGYSF